MKRWYASTDVPIPPGSATQPTTPKRWRPRFSVRTLVIVVTLVCCYAACWGPTKTRGPGDVQSRVNELVKAWTSGAFRVATDAEVVAPLIIATHESHYDSTSVTESRRYYLWFFGYVAKLPFERDVPLARGLADSTYDGSHCVPWREPNSGRVDV